MRSPAFKAFHRHIGDRFREDAVAAFATDAELIERFKLSEGRPPDEGELLGMSLGAYDDMVADPMSLVTTMIRQHDALAEMLNRFHLQVVELGDELPGFVIGDTPWCTRSSRRAGTASAITSRSGTPTSSSGRSLVELQHASPASISPPVLVRTRKKLDAINAIFLRAALAEVACHSDDAKALRQTHSRLDRLPPSILTGP